MIFQRQMQFRFQTRHFATRKVAAEKEKSWVREKRSLIFGCISSQARPPYLPCSSSVLPFPQTAIFPNSRIIRRKQAIYKRDFGNESLWPRIWNEKDCVQQSDFFVVVFSVGCRLFISSVLERSIKPDKSMISILELRRAILLKHCSTKRSSQEPSTKKLHVVRSPKTIDEKSSLCPKPSWRPCLLPAQEGRLHEPHPLLHQQPWVGGRDSLAWWPGRRDAGADCQEQIEHSRDGHSSSVCSTCLSVQPSLSMGSSRRGKLLVCQHHQCGSRVSNPKFCHCTEDHRTDTTW